MALVLPLPVVTDGGSIVGSTITAAAKDRVTVQVSPVEMKAQTTDKNFLVVSPYEERLHQLDLRTVDAANALLANALTGMKCLRDDYATSPYEETFNWPEIVTIVKDLARGVKFSWKETSFYIVVFRSRIPPTTLSADLGVLDKAAHAEATASGGFLKYWFGSPDEHGRNLATCVWRSQEDAKIGSVGVNHRRAAAATRRLYTEWQIERLRFTIKNDAEEWELAEWVD